LDSFNKFYASKDVAYFQNIRREIKPLLPKKMESILEVGCGSGATLQWIKAEFPVKWIGGVELNEDVAVNAKECLDFFMQGNIENMKLPLENNSLDLILCLDVLEHLVDPWSVVKYLSELLKSGGVLIVSLPNICHHSAILPLLFHDRWDYEESGILDRTHMRFFTKKTSVELCNQYGLNATKVLPVVLSNKCSKTWLFNTLTLHLFQRYLTTQYLIQSIKI
jgi:2-polyprenyl-3-methyl-5-hydroxy-6-metoxy-1,4-benzoquinol methylase